MRLKANTGYYLTQAEDVAISERRFEASVYIDRPEEAAQWREVSEAEKQELINKETLFDITELSPAFIDRVELLLGAISAEINGKDFTADEALKYKTYYPAWGDDNAPMGKQVTAGFRFTHPKGETMYEVIQPHALSEAWTPGVGTESLYKVVQETHAGTQEDPIPWQLNMALELDKYYTENDILYQCIRSSEGLGMVFHLADLVSGGYVQPVEE